MVIEGKTFIAHSHRTAARKQTNHLHLRHLHLHDKVAFVELHVSLPKKREWLK